MNLKRLITNLKPNYQLDPDRGKNVNLFLKNEGFTLIELMIVITIIGILLSVAAPSYKSATITANEAVLKKDLFTLRDVLDQYYSDHGKYPSSLGALVDAGYIRSVPKDPFTLSVETWVEIHADGEDGGIYDLHSGSDLVGLDGTPYNVW
ncbi:MAG: type IV pilin protein [Nitrospiria bacterium]